MMREREVMEEVGIKIKNIRLGPYTNDIFSKDNKHYITLFVMSDYDSGDVRNMEPEKLEEWRWVDWDDLPKPLFVPIQNFIQDGHDPFGFSKIERKN